MRESNPTMQLIDLQEIARRLDLLEQMAVEMARSVNLLTKAVQSLDVPRKGLEEWKDPWVGRF